MDDAKKGSQSEWEGRYQSGQTGWDRGCASPALSHWLKTQTLTPCSLLIPGCGRGYEVVVLAQQGFQVTAVDLAPSAITATNKRLAQHNVTATIQQKNLLTWEPEKPFDAIYEQTSLCALQPETWNDYSDRLFRWLKPKGQLFALFMQTNQLDGPPFHCGLENMETLFPPSRWQWSKKSPMPVEHPSGRHELGFVIIRR